MSGSVREEGKFQLSETILTVKGLMSNSPDTGHFVLDARTGQGDSVKRKKNRIP
jgi:hypothetical protein